MMIQQHKNVQFNQNKQARDLHTASYASDLRGHNVDAADYNIQVTTDNPNAAYTSGEQRSGAQTANIQMRSHSMSGPLKPGQRSYAKMQVNR